MKVQLLISGDCPHVEAARALLRRLGVAFEEIDVASPATPPALRGWGSPTILVDGRDVAGAAPAFAPSCRLYDGEPIPPEHVVRAAIDAAMATAAGRRASVQVAGAAGTASAAAIVAVLATACCVGPIIVALVGVGGAVAAAAIEPWRPWLLTVSALALGYGFWRSYRPARVSSSGGAGESCPVVVGRWSRTVLWASAFAVVLAAALPLLARNFQ